MKKLEDYSKEELIYAIRYRNKFDISSVSAIEQICAERRIDKLSDEWKKKNKENQDSLKAWIDYNKFLVGKYGTFKIKDLSQEELVKLSDLASAEQNAEKAEEKAYKKMNDEQDEQLHRRK